MSAFGELTAQCVFPRVHFPGAGRFSMERPCTVASPGATPLHGFDELSGYEAGIRAQEYYPRVHFPGSSRFKFEPPRSPRRTRCDTSPPWSNTHVGPVEASAWGKASPHRVGTTSEENLFAEGSGTRHFC